MDFATGEWTGVDSLAQTGDSAVTLEAFPIVGGCASVVRIARSGGYQRFQVQSFVAEEEGVAAHWEQYAVDNESPVLVKAAGIAESGGLVFTTSGGDHRRRERWTRGAAEESLRFRVEESSDGGKSFRAVAQVALRRKI